jgi:hypothetical protein
MTEFTTAFPGTHVTSWTDDEGFDMVTIGIPGPHVSVLWVGGYEDVFPAWEALEGVLAPRPYDPLYVALEEYMERLQDEYAQGYADFVDEQIARDNEAEMALREAGL